MDKLQALVDADVLRLTKKKKKVITNMISMQFGKELLGIKVPNGVLVPKVMTQKYRSESLAIWRFNSYPSQTWRHDVSLS